MGSEIHKIKIFVDMREPDHIANLLTQLGAGVERRTFSPGDYVLSSEC